MSKPFSRRADGASDAWQITWYDGHRRQTRQRSTRTSDFELAQRRLAEHYIAQGERKQEPAASVLIEHVLMRYYETYAKKLPSEHFAAYAIAHWKRFWKDDTIAGMTEDRIEEFTADLVKGKGEVGGVSAGELEPDRRLVSHLRSMRLLRLSSCDSRSMLSRK
jgi:hypothetical protein